jgi:hypothetical protein
MSRMEIIKFLNSLDAVLIPLNEKMPIPKGWQQLTESDPEALNPNSDKNIGVVLGRTSKGFVDIDIDDMEALLPKTGMEFGRKSKPRSHRIYRCQNAGTKRLQVESSWNSEATAGKQCFRHPFIPLVSMSSSQRLISLRRQIGMISKPM